MRTGGAVINEHLHSKIRKPVQVAQGKHITKMPVYPAGSWIPKYCVATVTIVETSVMISMLVNVQKKSLLIMYCSVE